MIMQACPLTQYIFNINLQNKKNKIKQKAMGDIAHPSNNQLYEVIYKISGQ